MLVSLPWGLRRTGAHLTQVSPAPNISHQPQGEKLQPRFPSPHPHRGGLAQHNHRWRPACVLKTEHPLETWDLLIVSLKPVPVMPQWWMVHWKAWRYHASLCPLQLLRCVPNVLQVAILWLYEGFWILMAFHCIASTAGLSHGDEQSSCDPGEWAFPCGSWTSAFFREYVLSCCRKSQVI